MVYDSEEIAARRCLLIVGYGSNGRRQEPLYMYERRPWATFAWKLAKKTPVKSGTRHCTCKATDHWNDRLRMHALYVLRASAVSWMFCRRASDYRSSLRLDSVVCCLLRQCTSARVAVSETWRRDKSGATPGSLGVRPRLALSCPPPSKKSNCP